MSGNLLLFCFLLFIIIHYPIALHNYFILFRKPYMRKSYNLYLYIYSDNGTKRVNVTVNCE